MEKIKRKINFIKFYVLNLRQIELLFTTYGTILFNSTYFLFFFFIENRFFSFFILIKLILMYETRKINFITFFVLNVYKIIRLFILHEIFLYSDYEN